MKTEGPISSKFPFLINERSDKYSVLIQTCLLKSNDQTELQLASCIVSVSNTRCKRNADDFEAFVFHVRRQVDKVDLRGRKIRENLCRVQIHYILIEISTSML